MEIAFFSDIHGNIDALRAAVNEAKEKGINKFIALGDYVGYYYKPNQVIECLLDINAVMIKGNHEEFIFKALKDKKYLAYLNDKYGHGHEIALSQLSNEFINILKKLPKTRTLKLADNIEILICHGSPKSINEYLYPDVTSKKVNEVLGKYDYLACGHTHYQAIIKNKNRLLFNPGSVGQPRERGKKGACWCSFDTKTKKVKFYDTKYDRTNVIKSAKKFDEKIDYLYKVLER